MTDSEPHQQSYGSYSQKIQCGDHCKGLLSKLLVTLFYDKTVLLLIDALDSGGAYQHVVLKELKSEKLAKCIKFLYY